jgi:hypothetical protein
MTRETIIGELLYMVAFALFVVVFALLVYATTFLLDWLFGFMIYIWVKVRCLFKRH